MEGEQGDIVKVGHREEEDRARLRGTDLNRGKKYTKAILDQIWFFPSRDISLSYKTGQ